jgi:hypothetical protein
MAAIALRRPLEQLTALHSTELKRQRYRTGTINLAELLDTASQKPTS